MKVEIERDKLLSNFEVFEHLKELQLQNNWKPTPDNKKYKKSFNPNLELITRDVTSYLGKTPTAIQSVESITNAMKELSKYKLEKIEKLQILNSAPHSLVNLYSIVEECDQRFTDGESQDILDIINRHFPQAEEEDEELLNEEVVEEEEVQQVDEEGDVKLQ